MNFDLKKKASSRFVISMLVLVTLYLLIMLSDYFRLPIDVIYHRKLFYTYNVSTEPFTARLQFAKVYLFVCLPQLLVSLAYSFYLMGFKEIFIFSTAIIFDWFFIFVVHINQFTFAIKTMVIFDSLMILMIFLLPLADYVCSHSIKVQLGLLIFSYLISMGRGIILSHNYKNPLGCTIIRSVIMICMLLVTIFAFKKFKACNTGMRRKKEIDIKGYEVSSK